MITRLNTEYILGLLGLMLSLGDSHGNNSSNKQDFGINIYGPSGFVEFMEKCSYSLGSRMLAYSFCDFDGNKYMMGLNNAETLD